MLEIFHDWFYKRTCSKKVALCDIAKIKKLQIFVPFENEASNEDFFCPQAFQVMLQILCVKCSVKIWSEEAQGYKSNILLLLYQYTLIDAFFWKSIIEIWEINPWRTNSSTNGSTKRVFTEIGIFYVKVWFYLLKIPFYWLFL